MHTRTHARAHSCCFYKWCWFHVKTYNDRSLMKEEKIAFSRGLAKEFRSLMPYPEPTPPLPSTTPLLEILKQVALLASPELSPFRCASLHSLSRASQVSR